MISLEKFDELSPQDLQARYAELVNAVRELQKLGETEGWRILSEVIEANASTVTAGLETQYFSSPEEVFKDQWMKGTVNGLRRVKVLLSESITYYSRYRDVVAKMLTERTTNGASEPEPPGGESLAHWPDPDINGSDESGAYAP